jgi:hypothetical protein
VSPRARLSIDMAGQAALGWLEAIEGSANASIQNNSGLAKDLPATLRQAARAVD